MQSSRLISLSVPAIVGALLVVGACGGPVSAQAAASKELTVARIYGQPSLDGSLATGLEWSPDGRRLSYFESSDDGYGPTQLWVMDATTGERRILVSAEKLVSLLPPEKAPATQRTGLGRATPEHYFWAPDGQALLFVSGGNLTWLNLETQTPKPVLRSKQPVEDPKVSPDGRWVSYLQDYNLWLVNVATGEANPLTRGGSESLRKGQLDWVYPEELDISTAYWWSPDSSRIAYLEMNEQPVKKYPIIDYPSGNIEWTRYPQAGEPNPIARLGVISLRGGETTWMDTGSDTNIYLPRVAWLPDGKRIAIERLNRAQTRLDLLLADVSTGSSKLILTETDKYWLNLNNDLRFFSDSRRFLWASERDGFSHLYLYDTDGKLLEQLTRGDWGLADITGFGPGGESGVALDESRGYAYFVSNKEDPTQLQLFRLSLRDKSLMRLTQEPGAHDIVMSPSAEYFVDKYSNSMTPPRQDLYRADGSRVAVIDANKAPELADYHLSPVKFLALSADDGTKLYAMMIRPPDFAPAKKYPVLINVYGGPHAQLVKNAWGGKNFLWHQMMAEKGYIVFTLDNRGMYGRGHKFETPIYRHFGRVELADQLAGVRFLKSLPYVDASRIGIWGWSYGGYMTLTAMFNAPDVFKAGVAVAPVTDWRLYDTIYTERYMGAPQENPGGYRDSSPVTRAAGLRGKLLLVHGTGDDNVHFANSAELLDDLIQAGKYPASLMIFPGRGHPISDLSARLDLFRRITAFILANL